MPVNTVEWTGSALKMIDQTLLPTELKYIECSDVETVAEAIEVLRVRGAPAIGVAAAWGVVIGAMNGSDTTVGAKEAIARLRTTRPTAVNLFWAMDRMGGVVSSVLSKEDLLDRLTAEAR
ncbi:MAG: S-methyl-5-thioribose-1-phosphate isomerase, partial [Candidatus Latescibacteria bacterium]|nr:S-methyl-5-thioribose-1-phosphate isomerase [Candidatus Latescibacterota bacterium]